MTWLFDRAYYSADSRLIQIFSYWLTSWRFGAGTGSPNLGQKRLSCARSRASRQFSDLAWLRLDFLEAGRSAQPVHLELASSLYYVHKPLSFDSFINWAIVALLRYEASRHGLTVLHMFSASLRYHGKGCLSHGWIPLANVYKWHRNSSYSTYTCANIIAVHFPSHVSLSPNTFFAVVIYISTLKCFLLHLTKWYISRHGWPFRNYWGSRQRASNIEVTAEKENSF